MTSMAHDCPYCGSTNSAFEIVQEYPSKANAKMWFALVECGVCKEIALIELFDMKLGQTTNSPLSPRDHGREYALLDRFKLMRFEPSAAAPRIAEKIPENVRSAMIEAEKSFAIGLYGAAAGCYRKAIEHAVKNIHPDGKGMLNARSRQIEKDDLMPKAMVGLLDKVRIFGNATMHEEDYDPNKEDCMAAREFVHLFLTYGFTLPAMIEEVTVTVEADPGSH